MQSAKQNNGESVQAFHGKNFHGEIQLKDNLLRLDIIDVKKGVFYNIQITDQLLENEHRRFLIFEKVDDLYNELVVNPNLEASDQNSLVFPIKVAFKKQQYQLKVYIPLEQRKFNNQLDKMQLLYQKLDKMNKIIIRQVSPQMVRFISDKNSPHYKSFEVIGEGPSVKFLGQTTHTPFVHEYPLPTKGIFQFKVRLAKLNLKNVFLGICGKGIRYQTNANFYYSPLFV